MYNSPIDCIVEDIKEHYDQSVFMAIAKVGINVDKEELLKALSYDRMQYDKGYMDRDAEIVRCAYCKHNPRYSIDDECPFVNEDGYVKVIPEDYGFCKWGEVKNAKN